MYRVLSTSLLVLGIVLLGHETAHAVFSSPINAGCYLSDQGKCRIHVDPFVINVNDGAGRRLSRFQITVNSTVVYRFEVDVSNPPVGDYAVTVPGETRHRLGSASSTATPWRRSRSTVMAMCGIEGIGLPSWSTSTPSS